MSNHMPTCSIPIEPTMHQLKRREVESLQSLRLELSEITATLQQTRNEFADYKAQQNRKELEREFEQAKIDKQNSRRSWLQVIIPLVCSPLITLFIEHFQDIMLYFRTLFH